MARHISKLVMAQYTSSSRFQIQRGTFDVRIEEDEGEYIVTKLPNDREPLLIASELSSESSVSKIIKHQLDNGHGVVFQVVVHDWKGESVASYDTDIFYLPFTVNIVTEVDEEAISLMTLEQLPQPSLRYYTGLYYGTPTKEADMAQEAFHAYVIQYDGGGDLNCGLLILKKDFPSTIIDYYFDEELPSDCRSRIIDVNTEALFITARCEMLELINWIMIGINDLEIDWSNPKHLSLSFNTYREVNPSAIMPDDLSELPQIDLIKAYHPYLFVEV